MELIDTGASCTRTFGIRCAFEVRNEEVRPCPVHLEIEKGYLNGRYVYQIVPEDHAIVVVDGSENPRGRDTPEDHLRRGAKRFLEVHARAEIAEKFIRAAENGIIREVFEHMCSMVPGRFCYYPLPERTKEIPVIHRRYNWLFEFFEDTEKMGYPPLRPGWFWGGEVKAGWITPTRQGNLIGSARVKAPCWVPSWSGNQKIEEGKEIGIKGNEEHTHMIQFKREVQYVQDDRAVLVFSPETTGFVIEHPQHERILGRMRGLVQFTHLARIER